MEASAREDRFLLARSSIFLRKSTGVYDWGAIARGAGAFFEIIPCYLAPRRPDRWYLVIIFSVIF